MQAIPNFNFKPSKHQIILFLRNYIYRTKSKHTVSSKEMTNIFYFQEFNKRPRPHEKEKMDSVSRQFGKCLTEFSQKYPHIIQRTNGSVRKYVINPIR